MVDSIDPVSVRTNAGLVAETQPVEPARPVRDRQEDESSRAQASVAAPAKQPIAPVPQPTPHPGFEMHLDGQTLRVYSEMRDPDTRRVMLRIPAGYKPQEEPPGDYAPTTLKT